VAVVYGGRSGEHEVSIESARSVLEAIDREKYEVLPVGVTREGAWHVVEPDGLLNGATGLHQRLLPSADPARQGLVPMDGSAPSGRGVDVVFPLVHGTYGEDGCLQGLFDLADVAYVGSGVLGSAVGMDKITMKAVFQAHGLPVVPYLAVARSAWEHDRWGTLQRTEQLGFPCFVKPSSLGSSVGISKVHDSTELGPALDEAARFGERLIVEQGIEAREVECGVLGNEAPEASVVGEILVQREFYDYEAKYHDPGTGFAIPADLSPEIVHKVQALAIQAFEAVGAAGMARVDFFMSKQDGSLYLNEINTIPGFTAMSVYPRLWQASGVSYAELIERLIDLAVQRHADRARNQTSYQD
jgi:D-alanine-D-alanine ligase